MNIFATLESLVKSPAGSTLLSIAESEVVPTVQTISADLIAAAIKANPDASQSELVDSVDGAAWHMLRSKLGVLGFAVDILRNDQKVDGDVRAVITAELSATALLESSALPLGQAAGGQAV